MAYSAFAVANAFIQRAAERGITDLSPMKLQKLMYFAQAWHLKIRQTPLLDDTFARWQHGPVIPAVYHEFKAFGYKPITRKATTLTLEAFGYPDSHAPIIPAHDASSWNLVDAVLTRYGQLDATTLSNMTHLQGSAWAKEGGDGSAITHQEIILDPTIQ